MPELCLNLICPLPAADRVMDCLTALPQGHRFVSSKVSAHHFVSQLNALEQVQGRAGAMLIQVLVPQGEHTTLLDALKAQCRGADLHYWLSPVFASGAIA
jgi:hypothetical protein